ncbi:CAP domain-containing protein [Streptomyces minutiscleroticus]|uniref:CAP domain-containing protein n=1 Tax=Streptomyces minutiscleroticus TaxID=68238 RepID=UPI00331EE03B
MRDVDRKDEEGQEMGRHRRSAAGRAATDRATGATQSYDTHTPGPGGERQPEGGVSAPGGDPFAKSTAYLFATEDTGPHAAGPRAARDGGRAGSAHRRRKKSGAPVRTGLLGASAAVALGAVAVASGLLPGGDGFSVGGGGSDNVRAADSPTGLQTQGGTDGTADVGTDGGASASAGTGTERSASPSAKPTKSADEAPKASASKTPSAEKQRTEPRATPTPSRRAASEAPAQDSSSSASSSSSSAASQPAGSSVEAQVVALVNQERAKVGCRPLTSSGSLAKLAEDFSVDMAERDFFDHTDPDGATPWDRAADAGISSLGGENIARGQADAAAVMDAWMNSPGHRANILNCDFRTIGVGAHFASGGPWWTQDFGY